MFVLLRGCSGDDTIFLNVLRSSSDPWSNNEIPVLITGAGFLLGRNPVIFRSCWRRGGFYFLFNFFCSRSICFILFCGVGKSSGIVPPKSSMVSRTFLPT